MNPVTHHTTTGEQRKRKASDHSTLIKDVGYEQVSSPSNYINGGTADTTMVSCPCIHCPRGWHNGMTMVAVMNVDNAVANEVIDLDALPVGFRFVPTDEELIKHYLTKKLRNESVPKSKIYDADIYESHPEVLVAKYPQAIKDGWYFFNPRSRKYANGNQPDRKAGPGCWKATGPDKVIKENGVKIGGRKSLVYYLGHAPNQTKTKWMMHEFVIKGYVRTRLNSKDNKLDDYVLSKIYIKKKKDEGDTDKQQPSVASNDLAANLTTNVRVENEPVLVNPDIQPGQLVLSSQDVDHVSFHGENNMVVQHDSDQNINSVGTSLVVSDEHVHPAFQVNNNVAPQSDQNTGFFYDLVPPNNSTASYSSLTMFNHEYSPLPPNNMHEVMYGCGSTSNYLQGFPEHGYDGFLDDNYQPEFDGSM